MLLLLTSSPCDDDVPEGVDLPCILFEKNGFVDVLRDNWTPDSRFLIVAADPDAYELNDEMAKTFYNAFLYHDLTISQLVLVDSRNEEDIEALVADSDFIMLSGGHVPTENAFFHRMGLRELLTDFDGIVMGISAGTMNCADVVYAQPELEGESVDPAFERWIPGLGLTDTHVLPHYQKVKDYMLDGRRLYEDITYEDSWDNEFFALVDGSFIIEEDGYRELRGEAYLIVDGEMEQICEEGESLDLSYLDELYEYLCQEGYADFFCDADGDVYFYDDDDSEAYDEEYEEEYEEAYDEESCEEEE